jgi:hypothetical protein
MQTMTKTNKDCSTLLLGHIPSHLRLPEQVPRWSIKEDLPTYQFLRDPFNLDELNAYTHPITIWRDNRTLTYFSPGRQYDLADNEERYLTLMFGSEGPILYALWVKRIAV